MELAPSRGPFRNPYALTLQAALLFLLTILPVLLIVGWLNHQYARSTLEEQITLDSRARTAEIEQTFANVLLRELERLTTLAESSALVAVAPAPRPAADRAQA